MSPLILPGLAFGLAALMYFTPARLPAVAGLILAGHLIVVTPFVLRTADSPPLPARSGPAGRLRASAPRWFYTLPPRLPAADRSGIAAGAFLAFMASIDNVPVSLFLSSARTDMLPIRMWGMMESTLDVRIAAVSGVLITAAFLLMLIMEWTVGLTRRMRD